MTDSQKKEDRAAKWLRWTARGVGSLVAGYWLFIALAYAISGHEPRTVESLIMIGLIIASTIGVLIARWQERSGGIVLLLVALAHSTFALISSGHNRGFAVLISGGPFLLPSVPSKLAERERPGYVIERRSIPEWQGPRSCLTPHVRRRMQVYIRRPTTKGVRSWQRLISRRR